jgi:bifunctional non-homologous end joining protein LigD
MAFQRKKPAAIGIKAKYPGFIEPELATSVDKVPSGERWIHEVKFDGYRVQVHLRDAVPWWGGTGLFDHRWPN